MVDFTILVRPPSSIRRLWAGFDEMHTEQAGVKRAANRTFGQYHSDTTGMSTFSLSLIHWSRVRAPPAPRHLEHRNAPWREPGDICAGRVGGISQHQWFDSSIDLDGSAAESIRNSPGIQLRPITRAAEPRVHAARRVCLHCPIERFFRRTMRDHRLHEVNQTPFAQASSGRG